MLLRLLLQIRRAPRKFHSRQLNPIGDSIHSEYILQTIDTTGAGLCMPLKQAEPGGVACGEAVTPESYSWKCHSSLMSS